MANFVGQVGLPHVVGGEASDARVGQGQVVLVRARDHAPLVQLPVALVGARAYELGVRRLVRLAAHVFCGVELVLTKQKVSKL